MKYVLKNKAGLCLMMIDGNTKDYSFTNEISLAMKFSSEESAKEHSKKLPMLKLKVHDNTGVSKYS